MRRLILVLFLLAATPAFAEEQTLKLSNATRVMITDNQRWPGRAEFITNISLRPFGLWLNNFFIWDVGVNNQLNEKLTLGYDVVKNVSLIGQYQVITNFGFDLRAGLEWRFDAEWKL
jgi:hypothetical protein